MSDTAGLGTMIRLVLRRDRLRLPLWVLGISAVDAASVAAVKGTYGDPEAMASYGPTAGASAASKITSGRQVALDTMGGIALNETTIIATVGVTLMVVFLVVRHTRAEEESGSAELLRSGVVGRHTATLAAALVAVVASVLVGGLHALSYAALGLETTGSLAFGAEVAMLGVLFTGVAAAASQVTASARAALGIAGGLLGATYVLRGVGAIVDGWLYWVSPFGWAQAVDAYGDERWWLLTVLLVAALAFLGLTGWLASRRDAGAGLIQPRPGPARADGALGTAAGLAWRGQKGLVVGWAVGLAALAAIYGSVIPEVPKMLEANPDIADMIGIGAGGEDALVDGFLGYINLTLGVIAAVFGVSSVLRLRHEEDAGRLESLLATRFSRGRFAIGSLAVTVAGTVLMAAAMGVGMVLGYLPVGGETDRADQILLGLLGQLPAMLLVAAVAWLLVSWVPRWSALAWLLVVWIVLVAFLAETLKFPEWVRATSPFHHLPLYPAEAWTAGPTLALLGLTLACAVLGMVGFRRRDLG